MDEQVGPMRAADLAGMLRTLIFDADDAATLLGICPGSLNQALYRRRIAYVRYGDAKDNRFFTRADLDDYATGRGPGASSDVQTAKAYQVMTREGKKVVREIEHTW